MTDIPDEQGDDPRVLPSAIEPLTLDTSMAGIAYPVHGYPDDDCDFDANMRRFSRMRGDVPEESVIAYQSATRKPPTWRTLDDGTNRPELSGTVLDSGVRDVSYILWEVPGFLPVPDAGRRAVALA